MIFRRMNGVTLLGLLIMISMQMHLSREQHVKGLMVGATTRELQDRRPAPVDTKSVWEGREDCLQYCQTNLKFCSCGASCYLFNDCCDDLHFTAFPLDERMVQMISYHTNCLNLGHSQFRIVDECPDKVTMSSFPDSTKLKEVLPVIDENNITFKNEFFAKCHGVSSYSPWRITFHGMTNTCDNRGRAYVYADSMIKLFSNKSLSPSQLGEYLLQNGCGYEVFPPQGRSVHFCRDDIVEIQNCSDIVRPVLALKSWSYYGNVECCRSAGICKTTNDYTCKIGGLSTDPLDGARVGDLRSSLILLDFIEENKDNDIRIQYLNIKFEKTLTSASYQDINDEVIYSAYCLLKIYFDHVTDVFVIDEVVIHVEKISINGQSTLFLSSFTFNLLSNRIIENIDDLEEVSNWLDQMDMSYTLNITDGDGVKETYFELALLVENEIPVNDTNGNVNVSRSTYLSKRVNQRGLFTFHGAFALRQSAVCRMLKQARKPPTSRCDHLYAVVGLSSVKLNILWDCTLSPDTKQVRRPQNVASISSTGETLTAACAVLLLFTGL